MKTLYRIAVVVILLAITTALVGFVIDSYWTNSSLEKRAARVPAQSELVDEQPLLTAEQLAPLASTPEEQDFAVNALRLADHEVDLSFASALRNATQHPAPLAPPAKALTARIADLQEQVKAQQDDINRIKQQLTKAKESEKQSIEDDLQLQQALLEVSQEELDGDQQELIRAGGDPKSIVQRLQEQHDAGHQRENGLVGSGLQASQQESAEMASRSVVAQSRLWIQLNSKSQQLAIARQELTAREAAFVQQRRAFEEAAKDSGSSASGSVFAALKRVAEQQRDIAELDKRTQDLQSLDTVYANWSALLKARQRATAFGLAGAMFWIVAIAVMVLLVNPMLGFILSGAEATSRRLRTVRVALRFALQMLGVALILLIILGPPSQLATVLALAGAGLTVALKDFIVGFIGWFALMGPNGIRVGDWVEIDGVGGEVLEVGPLHTILLETGGWSDAGHPTGRKVTFVNSFAIEGHYFNFSTSGQWLWDEIQVPIPAGIQPQPIVEEIQKIVAKETEANARVAEKEWHRVAPRRDGRAFSALPSISVQPTGAGVTVVIRYITRAPDWREVRSRLYSEIITLLGREKVPTKPDEGPAPKPVLTAAEPK